VLWFEITKMLTAVKKIIYCVIFYNFQRTFVPNSFSVHVSMQVTTHEVKPLVETLVESQLLTPIMFFCSYNALYSVLAIEFMRWASYVIKISQN